MARAGGLIAVAVLPALAGLTGRSYVHPDAFTAGFRHAVVIAGAASAFGGVLAAALVRNLGVTRPTRAPGRAPVCCALEATPLHAGPAENLGTNLGRA